MVNLNRLKGVADKAKNAVEKRGGSDTLKEDFKEVGDAVKGKGSIKDKAKGAAKAVKEPGKNEPEG